MAAVADSSPLIYLAALGDLELARALFKTLIVPEAVYEEVVLRGAGSPGAQDVKRACGDWIEVRCVRHLDRVRDLANRSRLHRGEIQGIILAEELGGVNLLMDDQPAVIAARRRGLEVIRTPALYIAAKSLGLIRDVRPRIELLRKLGFRLKEPAFQAVLEAAGES